MGSGIFAEVDVGGTASCRLPIEGAGGTVGSVARSTTPDDGDAIVEEFTVEHHDRNRDRQGSRDGDEDRDRDRNFDLGAENEAAVERVFDSASGTVYRFAREERGCACDRIEDFGCPIRDVDVRENGVVLTFFAPDVETLQAVIGDLKEHFETVTVRRLLRSDPAESTSDLVFVDRATLTDRQREILEVANEMGYFAHPREANAEAVSSALDITVSTFAEHLAAAQSKLMDALMDDRP